jgi:hypothetical protein
MMRVLFGLDDRLKELRNDIEVYERERLQNAQVYQLKATNLDSIIEGTHGKQLYCVVFFCFFSQFIIIYIFLL